MWLSIIDELNYLIFLKLMKIFQSTVNLYNVSKDNIKFEEVLKSNNFNLEENLKSKILDNNLKIKSNKIYNNLKSKNIKVIPINSKFYPQKLKNIFSPPLCLFVSGDLNLLKNKKIYLYEENNITKYAKKINNLVYEHILKSNYLILNKNFNVLGIDLLKENYFKSSEKIDIYYNSSKYSDFIDIEIKSGILDLLVIAEANYNKYISIFVDCFLELGKEICVFPNEIFNKNAYFSNYLIKNGADILTNIYQIQDVLNNL